MEFLISSSQAYCKESVRNPVSSFYQIPQKGLVVYLLIPLRMSWLLPSTRLWKLGVEKGLKC